MLSKKELRVISLPKLYKSHYGNLVWSNPNTFIVRSRIEPKGNILVVAFYSVKYPEEKPVYTLFLTKKESITLDRSDFYDIELEQNYHKKRDTDKPKEKWLTGCIQRYVYSDSNINYGCKRDYACICQFLGEPISLGSVLSLINFHQRRQKEHRLAEKKENRLLKINQFMKCVPTKLPEGLENWITRVPLLASRYILYNRLTPKSASGYCTHCKKEIDLLSTIPRHNEIGICPVCRSKITFFARGIMKNFWCDEGFCTVARRTKNKQNIVFSFFEIRKHYKKEDYKEPEIKVYEAYRIFTDLTGKITDYYRHGYNNRTGTLSWFSTDFHKQTGNKRYHFVYAMYYWKVYSCYENQCIYPYNFRNVIKETAYEQLDYDLLPFTKEPGDVLDILEKLQAVELLEKLEKVGLVKLRKWFIDTGDSYYIAQRMGFQLNERRLHKKLGLSKDEYRMFAGNNFSMDEYDCLKAFRGVATTPNQIKFLSGITSYTWAVVKNLLTYTALDKIILYIANKFKRKEYGRQLNCWNDYLKMCRKQELATWYPKILFPVNLQEEHDRLVNEIKEQEESETVNEIAKRYLQLHKDYEYEDERYMIIAPRTYSDIAREAKRLNNCLISANHYREHAEGSKTLLFLRRKENPDAAFFCFSMDIDENITSIEGCQKDVQNENQYRDRIRPSKAEYAFLDAWQITKCNRYRATQSVRTAA